MKSRLFQLIYYGLPALFVAVSALALNSGTFLKRPFGAHDDIAAHLEQLLSHTEEQRWEDAGATVRQLGEAWRHVRGRVRLSSAFEEVEAFDLELAGLQGALESGDASQTRIAVRRLLALWEDIGS